MLHGHIGKIHGVYRALLFSSGKSWPTHLPFLFKSYLLIPSLKASFSFFLFRLKFKHAWLFVHMHCSNPQSTSSPSLSIIRKCRWKKNPLFYLLGISKSPLQFSTKIGDRCGLPFPSSGDIPNPGIQPMSLKSHALAGEFFTTGTTSPI